MTVTIHLALHVLLVLCLHDAFAQIFGTQTQYNELNQRQLSPIQQGHILSDIQQHQHRFNLNQQHNHLNQPQQFSNSQFNPNFNGPNLIQNQPFISQQQQSIFQNQPVLSQPPIQPTLVPTSQPIPTQSALPTLQNNAQQNRVVQHLTQTAFSPYKQDPQLSAHQHLFQVTSNPLFNLDDRPQDPEKEKQRLKELQEKQSIIEKHNQFVEKQYKKALEKAQEEHADFIKVQQEEKRKLYQKFYKPTGNQGFRYRQNNARYIYPEEKDLFDLAVKKYYEEHPTTTTTTTTTTTPAPPTTESDEDEDDDEPPSSRKGKILNQKTSAEIFQSSQSNLYPTEQKSFRPTVIPKVSAIQNLEDLNKLKTQYKSQQIAKDDLIAQLKLAISQGGENDLGKNLTSREIALPNGQRIEIIRTTDPKLVPDAKPIEAGSDLESLVQERFGSQVRLIQDPNQLKSEEDQAALDKLVKEKFNLPDGGDYEIIRTTDPKAIQKKYGDQVKLIQGQPKQDNDQEALDKLVKEKFNLPDGGDYEIIRTNDPKEIQKKYGDQVKLIQPHGQTKKELDQEALDKLVKEKLNLPDGQDYEIIRTSDPKGVPGAIPLDLSQNAPTKPPKEIIQELTKGVVPPGANFEILKQGGNGGLETINGALPDQKKVTFVLLEEQNDGSFKVQGVKGNGEQEKGVDVDSILKKIKDGEIKLPPLDQKKVLEIEEDSIQSKTRYSTTSKPVYSTTAKPIYSTTSKPRLSSTTKRSKDTSTTFSPKKVTKEFIPSVTVTPNSFPSRKQEYATPILTTNIGTQFVSSPTTSDYYNHKRTSTTSIPISTEAEDEDERNQQPYKSPPNDLLKQASTISQSNRNSIFEASSTTQPEPTVQSYPTSTVTIFKSETLTPQSAQSSQSSQVVDLATVLKKNGLYAMAKYLKQSGLDTILNETGPYTLFAPNDKAFRTLLVQLGGPDKAEEKFKENPRLLSGLLLHHVIPGAFKIGSLQDEMTGVSLAGTQLRVNQYNMHDQEWNDVKVTTINGARVLDDRQDIEIPQGLAHGVDRVMFPLPVGDIVQTLQSDRERRFTTFLRALFASGLADTLQGPKTFTLFVPTERAFSVLTREELQKMVSDKTLAKSLVLSHLTPGTLYTNGMTYYQLKDSLDPEKQITISKSSGKIKVNNNLIATPNIPATNGVIHAIDYLL